MATNSKPLRHSPEDDDLESRQALERLTAEKDDEHTNVSLRTILGGDLLGGPWFRRQFWYIVMIVAMCILYVSNRYACQKEMIEANRLEDTLLDRRYKALTISSQLKEMTLPSVVERNLRDTALRPSTDKIYNLPVDAKKDTE